MSAQPTIQDAILLVAGVGSRLRPMTDELPKCLLELGGVPLLIRLLRQLHKNGIQRAVLATGYLEPKIRAAVAGHQGLPEVVICHNPAYASTNNAESLRQAMPATQGRPFILCDGDILVRRSGWLGDLLRDPRGNVLAMITPESMAEEEMKIELAERASEAEQAAEFSPHAPVVGLSKEMDVARAAGESIGVQLVSERFWGPLLDRLDAMSADERARVYYEDIFAVLMGEEHPFYAHQVPADSWIEIDTPEDLEVARALFSGWDEEAVGAEGAQG